MEWGCRRRILQDQHIGAHLVAASPRMRRRGIECRRHQGSDAPPLAWRRLAVPVVTGSLAVPLQANREAVVPQRPKSPPSGCVVRRIPRPQTTELGGRCNDRHPPTPAIWPGQRRGESRWCRRSGLYPHEIERESGADGWIADWRLSGRSRLKQSSSVTFRQCK